MTSNLSEKVFVFVLFVFVFLFFYLAVVRVGACTRPRAGDTIPLVVVHAPSAHGAASTAAVKARLFVLTVSVHVVISHSAAAHTGVRVRRLAVGPARRGVVPVRVIATILEPPAVVGVVEVLDKRGVLVARTIIIVVVVPVTARAVQPLERRERIRVRGLHDLADDAAAARDDENNDLCRGGRHLVRLTCLFNRLPGK
jgi:hypothetical protein